MILFGEYSRANYEIVSTHELRGEQTIISSIY